MTVALTFGHRRNQVAGVELNYNEIDSPRTSQDTLVGAVGFCVGSKPNLNFDH